MHSIKFCQKFWNLTRKRGNADIAVNELIKKTPEFFRYKARFEDFMTFFPHVQPSKYDRGWYVEHIAVCSSVYLQSRLPKASGSIA